MWQGTETSSQQLCEQVFLELVLPAPVKTSDDAAPAENLINSS